MILAFVLIFALAPQPESTHTGRFDRATAAIEDGRFHDAARDFEVLFAEGHESGAAYLNYATAAERLGRKGEARWALARAERYRSVRDEAKRRGAALDEVMSPRGAPPARSSMPLILWMIGSTVAVALAVLAVARPVARRYLPLGALVVAAAIGVSAIDDRHASGVVVTQHADVFPQAASLGAPVSELVEGTWVRVAGRTGGRVRIVLPDGTSGWVDAHRIRTL